MNDRSDERKVTESSQWVTGVSEVREGEIRIRGYELGELIRNLTFTEAAFLAIRGELPNESERRAFDAVLCSILDHAFISSTIPAARFVASANPDLIAGLAAGILTVGSNTVSPQDSAELVAQIIEAADGEGSLEEAAEEIVRTRLASGQRVPGLGHPTHSGDDPRAVALIDVVDPLGLWGASGAAMEAAQLAVVTLKGRRLPINVDGAAGSILHEMGFLPAEIRSIGAMSYMPGIIAHVVEELQRNSGLRYIPLEQSSYTGVADRSLTTERDQRG